MSGHTSHPGRRADELSVAYARRLGEIDVLVISDGVFPLPDATWAQCRPAELAAWLDDRASRGRDRAANWRGA